MAKRSMSRWSYSAQGLMTALVLLAGVIHFPLQSLVASADSCPDVEVVYARGTGQPVGLGDVGDVFVQALQDQLPEKTLDIYPVDYPATNNYHDSAVEGASDASTHIQDMITHCTATKMILGGYSQGASVIELATDSMPTSVAKNVSAVVLFGPPTGPYSTQLWGGPLPVLAPPYQAKSIAFCLDNDIYCQDSGSVIPHLMYIQQGKAQEGAEFAAHQLAQPAK